MKLRKKRSVELGVERLEDRCVPAWLTSDPGPFTVKGYSDQGYTGGITPTEDFRFQLTASIVPKSDRYGVDILGAGDWYAVTSKRLREIRSPTADDWNALRTQYPGWSFAPSLNTLANNSLVVKDYEALGPSRTPAGAALTNQRVGQSLFIQSGILQR
jgi:hypothetical protein